MSRLARIPALLLVLLLLLPVVGLGARTGPVELWNAVQSPTAQAALGLSLGTTALALVLMVILGTPLAWWLSRAQGRWRRAVLLAVELPIVLPPAVLGVALLETFGRSGWLGPLLDGLGLAIPFTTGAVVLAQVVVGAPLFVLGATAAFAAVDEDHLVVARTLGAGPGRAWMAVALPAAGPGLMGAAAMGWARALGEFGATLMFAGNLPGRTQTAPLAIYAALERDLSEARALSVVLVVVALVVLVGVGRRA